MALTDVEKNFIVNYSQQLLQQDMLVNQLFGSSSVGKDIRSLVLGETAGATVFTNPTEQALSGSLRANSDAIRQASRNVGEGATMMGVAKNSMSTIVGALGSMKDIIADIEAGNLDASSSVVQDDYNALRDKITGTIDSTDFNGIYMLDSSKWGTEQINSKGQVYIQSSSDGGFNISFHAVNDGTSTVDWSDLSGAALDGSLATQKSYVDSLKSWASTIENMYGGKVDNLESQKIQLEGQAQLLDNAAQSRMPSHPEYSLEKLVADLIVRNIGGVIDTNG